jgi:hypothetical protein
MSKKTRFYKLSPELVDGSHSTVIPCTDPHAVADALIFWMEDDHPAGESVTIEIVEMGQEELDALPEL